MATKKNIYKEKLAEYLKARKARKGEILDAVMEVTGMKRKSAVRRFRELRKRDPCASETRGRPKKYTADVIAALKEVWEIGSEACGENLHPMMNEYISSCGNDWKHSVEATEKLRSMSLGSVKEYVGNFVRTRRNFGGKSTTKKSAIISMVPIRMDGWSTAETGVAQIDTVAHCGDTVAGDYVVTTNATDVATLWGTRRAQWCKGQEATQASIEAMRLDSPLTWTEIHPDSGSEFINQLVIKYAASKGIRMTRSRPYHKNDNCFVEERNGHSVRVHVGYDRMDAIECVKALNDLYDVLTPYLNHFIASRRIVEKQRIGARWKVSREKVAKTPYMRVLERADVSEEVKTKLRAEHAKLNPRTMKKEIDRLKAVLHTVTRRYGSRRN